MAGIRLEFAQFGYFDFFNIYRNLASTTIENLGEPIGTSSTMYYEDLTTEPNRDYYYRVGVIRDLAEEFSEEFHVKTLVEFDPPYDLVVEFKNDETNRLELSWKLDGFVDEQRYYCSTGPMNVESLPVPKVILANDVRSYIDTDIIEGQLYYVRVGSVKNGVVKLSNEISISTEVDQYWSNVIALLHFDNNLTDEKGSAWTISGTGLSYTDSISGFGKKLTKADMTTGAVTCSNNTLGDLAHDDFTIEFNFVLPSRAYNPNYPFAWLLATDTAVSTGVRGWQIAYDYTTNNISFASSLRDLNGAALDYVFLEHNTISLNTKHHIAVTRLGDTFKLFIDGVLVAQATKHATMNSGKPILIGYSPANVQTQACFSIDELRITKGVARYTANFTPPVKPFLNP